MGQGGREWALPSSPRPSTTPTSLSRPRSKTSLSRPRPARSHPPPTCRSNRCLRQSTHFPLPPRRAATTSLLPTLSPRPFPQAPPSASLPTLLPPVTCSLPPVTISLLPPVRSPRLKFPALCHRASRSRSSFFVLFPEVRPAKCVNYELWSMCDVQRSWHRSTESVSAQEKLCQGSIIVWVIVCFLY